MMVDKAGAGDDMAGDKECAALGGKSQTYWHSDKTGDGEYWQANMAALASHFPDLHALIRQAGTPVGGDASLVGGGFWSGVYSHLDTVPPDAEGLAVFLGMGLGYGPLLILQERPGLRQIAILEPSVDLFCAALATVDLRPLISSGKALFFVGDIDWESLEKAVTRVAALEDTHILRHLPSFKGRPALYGPVNDRAYMLLNQINASGSTTRKCGQTFIENRSSSLTLLRHAHSLDALRGLLAGKPAVVVAAGPSLERSLPALREMVGRCALIAADSALAPLLRAGIVPDIVTSIDYLDLNFEKIAPFLGQEWPFSLVSMIKATPLLAKRLPVRQMFFGFAEDLPHHWIVKSLGLRTLAPACSSVAHLSLGVALIMDCAPIVFVGQDLSYTDVSLDHVDGTIIMRRELPQDRELMKVPAVGGGTVATDRQFLSLLKVFEDIIGGWPRQYINASASGARIRGTEEKSLSEVAACHAGVGFSVGQLMAEALAAGPSFQVDEFVRAGRANLQQVILMAEKLKKALGLGQTALKELARLTAVRKVVHGVNDLSGSLRKLLGRFDALNNEMDNTEALWEQVVELTFGMLSENDRYRQSNDQIMGRSGYLAWLTAELERIDRLNRDRAEVLAQYSVSLRQMLDHFAVEESLAGKEGAAARLQMAGLHLQAGNYLLARRLIDSLPLAVGQGGAALLLAGEAKAGLLDFAGADADWRRALALDPGLGKRVDTLRQRFCDEWLGFIERYANPGETGDNFPHLLPVWLERVMGAAGDRARALTLLRPVFERHLTRLEALIVQDKAAEAEEVLSAWQAVFGDAPEIFDLRAKACAAQGDYRQAVCLMEQAISSAPADLERSIFVVRTLLKDGCFDEGLKRLGEAVSSNPKAAILWEEVGDMLFAAGDWAGAVLAFEHCFLALPERIESLLKMGHAYRNGNNRQGAMAAYEEVLRRQPDNAVVAQCLAELRQTVQ